MTVAELEETQSVLQTMMTALYGTVVGAPSLAGADLYYGIGDLLANANTLIRSGVWGAQVLSVFDLAFAAGATVTGFETVRTTLVALAPVSPTATALVAAGIQMALAEEVKILAATVFTSKEAAQDALAALNCAFDEAVEFAADNHAPSVFQALIAAHGAAVRDLTTRAQPLASLITYSFARSMTSHALANRLYGDASRCDQLRALGDVIAPAFMPVSGPALSE